MVSVWGDTETQYFYQLTPDYILSAFEKASGRRATGRCMALNSMENRVYDIEMDVPDTFKGPRWEKSRIIKFYRPGRWSKDQILDEHQFLYDLRADEIPVVAPEMYDGQSLFEDPQTGLFYTIFPKVGGRSPSELELDRVDIVGRLLARMHNVGASRPCQHRVELNCEVYGQQNLEYLLQSKALPLEVESEYKETVARILDIAKPWFEQTPIFRIHGDAHLGNLLWGDQGPFWVDFDDFVRGPAVQDIWLMLPGRGEDAREFLRQLLRSYQMMRDFDYESLKLIEALRALRFIHFSAWIKKRWQDPAFSNAFPGFGSNTYWQSQLADLKDQLRILQSPAPHPLQLRNG